MNAEYNLEMAQPNANFEKVQKEHLKRLEEFVASNPSSPDSADAMIHLGLNAELTEEPKVAQQWYQKTAANFPNNPQGEKANGALLRLDLAGQEVAFAGTTLNGKKFTTAKLGKPVPRPLLGFVVCPVQS